MVKNRKLSTGAIQNFNESKISSIKNDYIAETDGKAVYDGVSSKYN